MMGGFLAIDLVLQITPSPILKKSIVLKRCPEMEDLSINRTSIIHCNTVFGERRQSLVGGNIAVYGIIDIARLAL
jgi:hypothetical protein